MSFKAKLLKVYPNFIEEFGECILNADNLTFKRKAKRIPMLHTKINTTLYRGLSMSKVSLRIFAVKLNTGLYIGDDKLWTSWSSDKKVSQSFAYATSRPGITLALRYKGLAVDCGYLGRLFQDELLELNEGKLICNMLKDQFEYLLPKLEVKAITPLDSSKKTNGIMLTPVEIK